MNILAWNAPPPTAELARAIAAHEKPLYLAVCLPDLSLPEFRPSESPSALEQALQQAINAQSGCIQFNGVNALNDILPDVHLWLLPPANASRLHEHFPQPVCWQTEPVAQNKAEPQKPWFSPPASRTPPERALVIGAGIAGAATARALAEHGLPVTVLEAAAPALAASGNRQGLLYAKISAHPTEQTELLLCGYGHSRHLLQRLLPEADCWGGDGVLHLNHNAAEAKRNQALGRQRHHAHLYRTVSAAEAGQIAGIPISQSALYWPQGVWLNPPALVHALLDHPLITLHTHTPLLSATHNGHGWQARTPAGLFHGSHIVYCTGAHSPQMADFNIAALPWRLIRGQTSLAAASPQSAKLRCALSAASYISPAWQGLHCYGATFLPQQRTSDWQMADETANRAELAKLHPHLAADLLSDGLSLADNIPKGHAALRCDSPDHLPIAGPLGHIAAMQQAYERLALDKNYRLNTPCPYLPDAYINSAHGSRGLATSPICAQSIAATILGLPDPLSQRIRTALHPNRTIVRAIVQQQNLLENSNIVECTKK